MAWPWDARIRGYEGPFGSGFVDAIVAGDDSLFSQLMDASASFSGGATRLGQELGGSFLKEIGHYIYQGDTALHFAATAYRTRMVDQLVKEGANVWAKNRRGGEPLHAADGYHRLSNQGWGGPERS